MAFDLSSGILMVAAVHRLLRMWLSERIAEPARQRVVRHGGWIGYLASCPYCLSVWMAAAVWGLWSVGGWPGRAVVITLAVSEAVLMWSTVGARIMAPDQNGPGRSGSHQNAPQPFHHAPGGSPTMIAPALVGRSTEDILRTMIGDLVIQLAGARAENQRLEAQLSAMAGRVTVNSEGT